MKDEYFFEKEIERVKKKGGRGYLCFGKYEHKAILTINSCKEIIKDFDIIVETDTTKIENAKDFNFSFIMKSEWKFVLKIDGQYFYRGYKEENELQRLLVYAKSEHMAFLFYFDVKKGILPFLDLDVNIDDMEVEPRLLEKYQQKEVDAITNLYHIVNPV